MPAETPAAPEIAEAVVSKILQMTYLLGCAMMCMGLFAQNLMRLPLPDRLCEH